MKIKIVSVVMCQFLLRFFTSNVTAQSIDLAKEKWIFKKGDDLSWATPQYSDADWRKIGVGATWEAQTDNEPYDGIAWYRCSVVVPKSARAATRKQGAMTLKLGLIDDADEAYFNGVKIGATGQFPPAKESAYNVPRVYRVPAALIRWDAPNVIAVRVADWTGGGGLYAGDYTLEPSSWKEKVKILVNSAEKSNAFGNDQPVLLQTQITNGATETIDATLTCEVKTFGNTPVATRSVNIKIPKGQNKAAPDLDFGALPTGFYIAHFSLKDKKGFTLKEKMGFAVAPENVKYAPTQPEDFDSFWANTRAELDSVPPQYQLTFLPEKSNEKVDAYEVEFRSLGNVRVRGYYTQPKNKTNVPALLHVQGYSSVMEVWSLEEDMAAFYLNIRGHGNSKMDVNPGFPGYLLSGLSAKESYIYRGAYMDCVRAIDFLCSRPVVDTARIAVEGGSQGGALSIATASLDKRVKLCAPDVPFLSNFRLYFDIAQWPANEFRIINRRGTPWENIYGVLDYFDVMNHTPRISVPVFMGVGLFDDICPPAINFSAYNNLSSEDKSFILYPQAGHSLPDAHYNVKMKWLRQKLMLMP